MRFKTLTAIICFFVSTLFVGLVLIPISYASTDTVTGQGESSALTSHSIDLARRNVEPRRLVALQPQTSVQLLSKATEIGIHPPDSVIRLTLGLKLAHPVKLQRFLRKVHNPASPLYHHWLTPDEARAKFGPTKAQVQKVVEWLKSRGIRVTDVTPNRILVHTKAKTALYERAFGIEINDYKLKGRTFSARLIVRKFRVRLPGLFRTSWVSITQSGCNRCTP